MLWGAVSISAGAKYSLAVDPNAQPLSWGYNGNGRLGIGNLDDKNLPFPVLLP